MGLPVDYMSIHIVIFEFHRNIMKNIYLVSLLGILLITSFQSKTTEDIGIKKSVKRILFLGNSITYDGRYVSDVEAWLIARYPNRHLEFINAGLPSETVSGLSEEGHADGKFPRPDLHERLTRVLKQIKPDLVLASYGMNDGIYKPFDESRFQKYKDGINRLHDEGSPVKEPAHGAPPLPPSPRRSSYAACGGAACGGREYGATGYRERPSHHDAYR